MSRIADQLVCHDRFNTVQAQIEAVLARAQAKDPQILPTLRRVVPAPVRSTVIWLWHRFWQLWRGLVIGVGAPCCTAALASAARPLTASSFPLILSRQLSDTSCVLTF